MEEAVTWVIGMIIFVFDPLAIFLIIAGNFLWAKRKGEKGTRPVIHSPDVKYHSGVPGFSMETGTKFPDGGIVGRQFFRHDLGQMFVYDGQQWTPVVESKPVVQEDFITEDFITPHHREGRGSRVETLPTGELNETEYTRYEAQAPSPELVEEPTPEPVRAPLELVPIEERIYEIDTEAPPPEPTHLEAVKTSMKELAETSQLRDRRTFVANGLLKPIDIEAPQDENDLDKSNFVPLAVPPPELAEPAKSMVEAGPVLDDAPVKREEITRSSLGLVQADPSTIVDARADMGFRRSTVTTPAKL